MCPLHILPQICRTASPRLGDFINPIEWFLSSQLFFFFFKQTFCFFYHELYKKNFTSFWIWKHLKRGWMYSRSEKACLPENTLQGQNRFFQVSTTCIYMSHPTRIRPKGKLSAHVRLPSYVWYPLHQHQSESYKIILWISLRHLGISLESQTPPNEWLQK